MPDYFDIHSHLNFPQFDVDRDEVVARMKEARIWTITVGTDVKTSHEAIRLASLHEGIYATVGCHPTHSDPAFNKDEISMLAARPKVVAIGECGLDFYRTEVGDSAEKQRQLRIFEIQIEAAVEHSLPLMIHARNAYGEVYDALRSYHREHGDKVHANMHFFAGTLEDAKKFLDLGFTLSFDGPITFADSYDEIIRFAPLDRIMAETDAPFAAPVPWRGKRNEPSYVRAVAERIAEVRGEDGDMVRKALVQNALKTFNLG